MFQINLSSLSSLSRSGISIIFEKRASFLGNSVAAAVGIGVDTTQTVQFNSNSFVGRASAQVQSQIAYRVIIIT